MHKFAWGYDCHNFALLSAGFIDIVIEHNLSWHDTAMGISIIEDNGGLVTDWNGVKIDLKVMVVDLTSNKSPQKKSWTLLEINKLQKT